MPADKINMALKVNVLIEVREAGTGRLLRSESKKNLVVNNGLNLVRDLIGGQDNKEPSHIAVGTVSTGVSATDTVLGNEVFRNTITKRIKNDKKITLQLFINESQANGNTLVEAGIFNVNATTGDVLFARVTYSAIVKTSSITVTISWEVAISAV